MFPQSCQFSELVFRTILDEISTKIEKIYTKYVKHREIFFKMCQNSVKRVDFGQKVVKMM